MHPKKVGLFIDTSSPSHLSALFMKKKKQFGNVPYFLLIYDMGRTLENLPLHSRMLYSHFDLTREEGKGMRNKTGKRRK